MAKIPELPHFDLPFRFEGGQLAVVEQDSDRDVENQVLTVLVCTVGFREELPAFGIPQPVFSPVPVDTRGIQQAVDEWVPNANAETYESGDALDNTIRRISVNIRPNAS